MTYLVDLLYEWQELAGAFLGPFLAVILSGITYLIGRKFNKRQEEKEAMRKIEISTSYTLNSIATMQKKLLFFVKGARKLIEEIRAETDPRAFALQTINFPSIGSIYNDDELLKMPTNSYYVHNKLLWIHSGVTDLNHLLGGLPEGFARIIRLNEKMLDLMKENPNPPAQRDAYAENLTIFADEIERFANKDLFIGVPSLIQVKVYNNKLRKGWIHGKVTRWKNEGVKSWVLRQLFKFDKPKRDLGNIDHMDTLLKPEVDDELTKMRKRMQQLDEEADSNT